MNAAKFSKIHVEMFFDHSPEKLFDAWLDPQNISTWLFASDKEILAIQIDAQIGGAFRFRVRRNGQVVDHIGKYLKLERPKLLSFTWEVPLFSKESSQVELKFEKANAQTKLSLDHENVLIEYVEATKKGWTKILNELDIKVKQSKRPHKA